MALWVCGVAEEVGIALLEGCVACAKARKENRVLVVALQYFDQENPPYTFDVCSVGAVGL